MAEHDHWQPVLPSHSLRRKPVGIKLAGKDIALFRTAEGNVGALDDICPHRRMKLSCGKVIGSKLQCAYHGWTFTADGQGESPGTPKLHACASSFDACESHGYIWVKSKLSNPPFPRFETEGMLHMCNLEHCANAPLEVTVDNFTEIEHTPTTHDVFGYELDRMKEVTVEFHPTESTVRTINVGPPKQFGFFVRLMVGVRKNYLFTDDWTTHYSPVHTVYDHFWSDPTTGKEARVRWRLYQFFTPVDDHSTRITTFAYAKSTWPVGPVGGLRPFRWLLKRLLRKEIHLDVEMLGRLANYDTHIEGMKLSRFDRALGLNRERIARIYRGVPEAVTIRTPLPVTG